MKLTSTLARLTARERERLRMKRVKRRMSLEKLADMIGCSKSTLSRLETGVVERTTIVTLDAWREALEDRR